MNIFSILVERDVSVARQQHAKFRSARKAWAVLAEELEEFKREAFYKPEAQSQAHMLQNLVQVAAMCQRAAEDLRLMIV